MLRCVVGLRSYKGTDIALLHEILLRVDNAILFVVYATRAYIPQGSTA